VVAVIAMVLQVPGADISVFLVFLLARDDMVKTVVTGLLCIATITVSIVIALFLTAFDVGSASLRLPIMALVTLAAMYASRALKIGPAAFLGGFALVKAQALVDESANTEELVRGLLWLWVIVALPMAVMVPVQLARGDRPATNARRSALALLGALADGLRHPGARDLRTRNAEAVELLGSTRRAAMVDSTVKAGFGSDLGLIETLESLLSMQFVLPTETPLSVRGRLADECDAIANAFERKEPIPARAEPVVSDATLMSAPVGVLPIVHGISATLERLREGLDRKNRGLVEPMSHTARPRVTNDREKGDNLRFAVKTTLAVMCAYFIYTGFAYPGISTALTTCLIVSLGSLGESLQKMILRISGALVGGVAAGLCIAFIRPSMTDIGHLTLLVGAGAVVCAWVAASSARLSYMGLQMAFAFFLGILQGYAPPSHFKPLIDRVIGIVLGNVLITVIFSTLWPTSAKDRAAKSIDQALHDLAAFVVAGTHAVGARLAVIQSMDEARRLDAFAKFELHMIQQAPSVESRSEMSVDELERIAGLAFVGAESPGSPAIADRLRREKERASELLLRCAGAPEVGPEISPHAEAPVAEGATPSDRAALQASALLLSELEKTHGVAC
jgi:multidrug resistance protein MdtO